MDKLFHLSKHGTKTGTEIIAGVTTFFTMAYIIFVNPSILSVTGMDPKGVFVATVLSAVVGTLLMAFVANLPYAQAPGMGLNAFFAFTVCLTMGFVWQEALAMVFICGIVGTIITVTKVRRALILAIPASLQYAIGGGIGLFISYIGIKNAGLLSFSDSSGVGAGADVVPGLVAFNDKGVLLALIGLVITIVLLLLKVKAALIIGIIATTILGIPMGIVSLEGVKFFDLSGVSSVKNVAFSFFGDPGLGSLFSDPSRILLSITAIIAFTLTDIFDTIGTLIGTGHKGGLFDEGEKDTMVAGKGLGTRMEKALFSDVVATTTGSLLGTSNVTTYVESAAGIGVGGRTGLTALSTSVCMLLCLPFTSLVGLVPSQATAPALIIVGIMMASGFGKIAWDDLEEAIPAFFTVAFMAFAYSISTGIAVGFIFYVLIKLVKGKAKEVHPIIYGSALFFIINFILQAI